jgi:hypothetical protein
MAASRERIFAISKDNTSRMLQSPKNAGFEVNQGSGGENHWIIGKVEDPTTTPKRTDEYFVTAQINFPTDWSNIGRVTSAVLELNGSSHHLLPGTTSRVWIKPTSPGVQSWTEGDDSEDHWSAGEFVRPPTVADSSVPIVKSDLLEPGIDNSIDMMPILWWHGPSTVLFRFNGVDQKGQGHENRGFRAYTPDTDQSSKASEFYSIQSSDASLRPQIRIVYEPSSTQPVATLQSPTGNVGDGFQFLVGFDDDDSAQYLTSYRVQVRKVGGTALTWDPGTQVATDNDRANGYATIDAPLHQWTVGQTQEWRAKVTDSERTPSDSEWTAWGSPFTVIGGAPTVGTPQTIASGSTMAGVHFRAPWTHPQGKAIQSLRIEVRSTTAPGSPAWDGSDNAWDSGDVTPTTSEQSQKLVNRTYGGESLLAGDYSWRVMVTDVLGVDSAWVYGTFTLTADWDAPIGAGDNSGWARKMMGFRIILREMGVDRGPGAIRAIIEDASNVGASAYVSAPGELYFTLPATHPQVGECEPYRTHYALEQYRNGKWQELFAGILTDFDATGDDAVINGMDYIGLLSLDIERRAWIKGASGGDARPRYHDHSIGFIIKDQLQAARDTTDSTMGFISIPPDGPTFQAMSNRVTIDASYRQRLEFIRGLIDSQRAGSGNRGRLLCRRVPGSTADETHGPAYEWNLLLDSGVDRPALRMEYGGLVQGFRIQAMGSFAVSTLAIGREVNELKPHYKTATAPGLTTAYWGNLAKVAVWQDIDDENDLARRAAQLAAESGRIGKRMALGLRVHGLGPFDGWDLTDSVPIDIVRGAVDTGHFAPDPDGLSWWTIWGTEYRINPDGQDELTLVVKPREDSYAPDPDLIVSKPYTPTPEWTIGSGLPPDPALADIASTYYLDSDTGYVYVLDYSTDPPTYVYHASMAGPIGPEGPPGDTGPPGPPGAGGDPTPPGAVRNLVVDPYSELQPDGTVISGVHLSWDPPADLDLSRYIIAIGTDATYGGTS